MKHSNRLLLASSLLSTAALLVGCQSSGSSSSTLSASSSPSIQANMGQSLSVVSSRNANRSPAVQLTVAEFERPVFIGALEPRHASK